MTTAARPAQQPELAPGEARRVALDAWSMRCARCGVVSTTRPEIGVLREAAELVLAEAREQRLPLEATLATLRAALEAPLPEPRRCPACTTPGWRRPAGPRGLAAQTPERRREIQAAAIAARRRP